MAYPVLPNLKGLADEIELYSQLQHEYGAQGISPLLEEAAQAMQKVLKSLQSLPVDQKLATEEPDDLAEIKALRPDGPRRLWQQFKPNEYRERLAGALLGRFAGCTLGVPVEFWTIERMQAWAAEIGDDFPPTNYWSQVSEPHGLQYNFSRRDSYSRGKMTCAPVDDDVTYTLLGLLIAEDYGIDFTTVQLGAGWVKYLPMACTAEKVALENLQQGIAASEAAIINNPYREWIGADIRSDPWGYLAPGFPELAAEMAHRDAYISHRRNGIYGEMYFAAAISAAFAVDDPVEALHIGLTEIPRNCALAQAVRWALEIAPTIGDYLQADAAVKERFAGMSGVHTIINACLTIWGITIGGRDFTRVVSQTVAMGMDNDCTTATAGSIVGAVIGKANIPEYWYQNFNDTVHSYINGHPKFAISDLQSRFAKLAETALSS